MQTLRWIALPMLFGGHVPMSTAMEVVLQVAVSGIERAEGTIRVAACERAEFLSHGCKHSGRARAQLGEVVVTINGMPEGVYALMVLHDLDGDGVLKRTFFGMPAEPVGFGNNAQVKGGPPSFEQSAINVSGRTLAAVTLRNR